MRNECGDFRIMANAACALKEEAEESVKVWEERVKVLEAERERVARVNAEREEAHAEQLISQQSSHQLAARSDADAMNRIMKQQVEDCRVLALAVSDFETFGGAVETLRQDVARLTLDNMAYASEVAAYEEALACRFDLHSSVDGIHALEDSLSVIYEEAVEQLSLQCEQQRCIDATERDATTAIGAVDRLELLGAELQPLVNQGAAVRPQIQLPTHSRNRRPHYLSSAIPVTSPLPDRIRCYTAHPLSSLPLLLLIPSFTVPSLHVSTLLL